MHTESDWHSFLSFAHRDSVVLTGIKSKDRTEITNRLQALMARQIWRTPGYYEVLNQADATVQKALQLLK